MRSANRAVAFAIIVLSVQVWAQAPTPARTTATAGPFAEVQDHLNVAADNILATADQTPPPPPGNTGNAELGNSNQPNLPTPSGSLATSFQRVQALRPILEPILREEGVPISLVAVVLVESGGQPMALSPKGARGIWQFMPDTARRYGLVVDGSRDERVDVQKSTRAAARYFRDLYQQFGSWELALAAYNAGEVTVLAAFAKAHGADFARVSASLPRESQSYVPAVLVAMRRFVSSPARGSYELSKTTLMYASVD